MHPDPWTELRQIAAERNVDLQPAVELLDELRNDGRFIDPENAVGNIVLQIITSGGSLTDAAAQARAEAIATLNEQSKPD